MNTATANKTTLGKQFQLLQEELKQKAFSEKAKKAKAQQLLEEKEKQQFAYFLESIHQYLVNCLADKVLPKRIQLHDRHIIPELADQYAQSKSIIQQFVSYNKPYYNAHCHVTNQFFDFVKEMSDEGIKITVQYEHDGCGMESWSVLNFEF